MNTARITSPLLPLVLLGLAAGAASAEDLICAQVITYGQSPATGSWVAFPTPCDVPDGWTVSTTLPDGYTPPTNDCVEVADDYAFSLSCVRYAGQRYQVRFTLRADPQRLSWELSEATPQSDATSHAIGEDDYGTTITLARGDTLQLTLAANPTTGYQWTVTAIDPTLLQEDGNQYTSSCTDPMMSGCGGHSRFDFTALAAGSGELTLAYYQPWEGAETAVEEYTVTVVVE